MLVRDNQGVAVSVGYQVGRAHLEVEVAVPDLVVRIVLVAHRVVALADVDPLVRLVQALDGPVDGFDRRLDFPAPDRGKPGGVIGLFRRGLPAESPTSPPCPGTAGPP